MPRPGVAYDSGKGEIFVTNTGSNTVSVISDESNTVVATVNVDKAPTGICYDPFMHEVFVSNSNSATVSVISDVDNRVVATITNLSSPGNMAYDSGKGLIWVCSFQGVTAISDADNKVVGSVVTTGNSVYGVAYDPEKNAVFVTNPTRLPYP